MLLRRQVRNVFIHLSASLWVSRSYMHTVKRIFFPCTWAQHFKDERKGDSRRQKMGGGGEREMWSIIRQVFHFSSRAMVPPRSCGVSTDQSRLEGLSTFQSLLPKSSKLSKYVVCPCPLKRHMQAFYWSHATINRMIICLCFPKPF